MSNLGAVLSRLRFLSPYSPLPFFFSLSFFFFPKTLLERCRLCMGSPHHPRPAGERGGQEYGARASQLGAFDEAALRNLI